MKKKTHKEERKATLKPILLLISLTAIMFMVSTYAWFTTQRAVTITNLAGKVNVAEGLEISLDANIWSNTIDLSTAKLDAVTSGEILGSYSATANHVPTELTPASTIGATGAKELALWTGTLDGKRLHSIVQCDESKTAGDAAYAGYFAFDVFLRNSSSSATAQQIHLSKDSSITVLPNDEGGDETTGLQNTVRLALAKFAATADVRASQSQIIASTVTADPNISQVAIWEPNANYHVDYMVTNAASYDFVNPSRDKVLKTYGLNNANITEIANVYATSGDKVAEQKVVQTSITVPETGNPTSYTTAETVALTDTAGETFALETNKVSRIRVYVWLEGQDQDCINYASHGGGIVVNFGLEKVI